MHIIVQKKSTAAIEFLWLALYAFAGFSLELLLGLFLSLPQGIGNLVTACLWLAVCIGLLYLAKNKFAFDFINQKAQLNRQTHYFLIGCVLVITIITTIGFGGFKPWIEFSGEANSQLLTYLFRIIYYLAEAGLILLTIGFAQHFADLQFNLPSWLPFGGIFLAVTWGTVHFFLQGLSGGLYTIAFSLIAGLIYLASKKDARWSYLYIALAFIL